MSSYNAIIDLKKGSGGNEVSVILSEIYISTNFNWSINPPCVEHFSFTATPGLKCLPNGYN